MIKVIRVLGCFLMLVILAPFNLKAQLVTGTDTLNIVGGQWEYFDFTAGKSFTIADTASYTPDFWGSSNEGVNFGKEFSSLIPNRRLYLLGSGDIDTVSTVPAWTDAAPWIDTSWDFTHGTQGQPISVGQLWIVYTREGLYAVMEIKALPEGNFGSSFVFDFKYLGEGGTTFPVDNSPQQLTGSSISTFGSGFDFSSQTVGDNEDETNYDLDFAFVSNEGVNFGNEGSSSLSGTGRRFLLLGNGDIDTVKTVPERMDSAPWVTVSYDFSDGTGGAPISVGQLWAVYTREGHYAVMEITDLPEGGFGSSFSFEYKYQPNGTRFFDGSGAVDPDPVPTTLSLVSGDAQTVLPSDTITIPFEVLVSDQNGNPIDLITVRFEEMSIPDGANSGMFFTPDGIKLNVASTFDGIARMNYISGDQPGEYHIKAWLPEYSAVDSVIFVVNAQQISAPDQITATAGAGNVLVEWTDVSGAIAYSLYRSQGDDNPAAASRLSILENNSYMDTNVEPGLGYFYWVESIDAAGNSSATQTGPAFATPKDIPLPVFGEATIVTYSGDGFSKQWQYFDFSKGYASNEADTGSYLADIRGTSNEGVNFGNENAPQIEGKRIIRLEDGVLEDVSSIPEWTNEDPWISVTWSWPNGTAGAPIEEGQLWGVYTREGNYAVMEITSVPEPFGDSLSFRYKYQEGGTPIFSGETETAEPDSMIAISGNEQHGLPGSTLEDPLAVFVFDSTGAAVEGVTVSFDITTQPDGENGAQLSASSVITNKDGVAFTFLTLGESEGSYIVTTSVERLSDIEFTVTAGQSPPPAPVTLVEIRDRSESALIPVWTESDDENFLRYRVYLSEDGENFSLADSSRREGFTVDTSRAVLDLTVLQEYFFAITVVNNDLQESEFSNILSGFPKPIPAMPENFMATPGDGAIQLNWSPIDTTYFSFYLVFARDSEGFLVTSDTLFNTSDTSMVIGGLTNGEEYSFLLNAENEFGVQGSSAFVRAIPQSAYEEESVELPNLINGISTWGDVDNDGDLDLVMTGQADESADPQTILLLNNGDDTFTDSEQDFVGVINSTAYWFDIDQNGYVDLILTGESTEGSVTTIYLNEEGTFTDAGYDLPGFGDGIVAPADFDNDGDLDFVLAGDVGTGPETVLIENLRNGVFEPRAMNFEGFSKAAAAWGDVNNDGRLDLLISGETENGSITTRLYINVGDNFHVSEASGTFKGVINGTVAFSDFNIDGAMDIVITGFTNTEETTLFTGLYTNTGLDFELFYSSTTGDGPGKILATARQKSRAVIGDYDNDGDADVLINAQGTASILKNNRTSIVEEALELGGANSVTWVDVDGDGDLDIVATGGKDAKILSNNTAIKNTPPTIPANLMTEIKGDTVKLAWLPSNDAQAPQAAITYNVRIGTATGSSDILAANADFSTGKLRSQSSGNAGSNTALILQGLPNGTYYWQVQAVDNAYLGSPFTAELQFEVTTSMVDNEAEQALPVEIQLSQNYPNPFNPSTSIEYSVPKADFVQLRVFDISGRVIANLVSEQKSAGVYTVRFNASNLASGLYFYQLQIGNTVINKKMTLIK